VRIEIDVTADGCSIDEMLFGLGIHVLAEVVAAGDGTNLGLAVWPERRSPVELLGDVAARNEFACQLVAAHDIPAAKVVILGGAERP
jgi:hypothetical protein